MDFTVVDESITITDDESFTTCHHLAQTEGILVGGSAGMNVCAAVKIANKAEAGSVVVTVLCDNGVKCAAHAPTVSLSISLSISLYMCICISASLYL